MKGQRIGYIRVNVLDQKTQRQLEDVSLDRVFTDKASAKDTKRPQLQEMIQFVREGDHVIIHSMDRLARNLDDLRKRVKDLTTKGVSVEFFKEKLTFSNENLPIPTLMLSVMDAFAEFERALILERQREGIQLAKLRGAYRGRARELSDEQVIEIKRRIAEGDTKTNVAKTYGVSRETLYKYLGDVYRRYYAKKKQEVGS